MHTIPVELTFNYAIRFPDGLYYMGPRYKATDDAGKPIPTKKQPRIDDPLHRGPKNSAYTYTENRAYVVIVQNKQVFEGCVVERIL